MEANRSLRLTKPEMRELERRFHQWQSAGDMISLADAAHGRIGSAIHATQAGLTFLREGFVAGHFANCFSKIESIRLFETQRPDFEMRFRDGSVRAGEITEADRPGRRRGDEYRGLPHPAPIVFEPVDQQADEHTCLAVGPQALYDACNRKADGRYAPNTDLVVYFNFPVEWYDRRRRLAGQFFLNSTVAAKDHFSNVFVLWESEVYWMWKDGQARATVLRPLTRGHGGICAA